jgi:ureidoglycolate lyase
MRRLALEPLTAPAFAAFGEVIDADSACEILSINDGHTRRHHALARVDCAAPGTVGISLFRADPLPADFVLRRLERHPLGSQAFINVSAARYAVVVAPAGDLDESALRGFLAGPGQGVNYHRGVWHHYLLALDAPADFAVVDRLGPGSNCDEQPLRTPVQLDIRA